MIFPAPVLARLAAIRTRAIRDSEDWVRAHIYAMEDAAIEELGQIFLTAYRALSAALSDAFQRYNLGDKWTATDAGFRDRTEALLAQIEQEIERLTDAATRITFHASVRGYQAGYYGRAW